MGCASSKQISATTPVKVYKPPPTSVAVFDINSVEEPWLKGDGDTNLDHQDDSVAQQLPPPVLAKITSFEDAAAPRSWDEVSKALNEIPITTNAVTNTTTATTNKGSDVVASVQVNNVTKKPKRRSFSLFHTIEEVDAKLKPPTETNSRKKSIEDQSTKKTLPKQAESKAITKSSIDTNPRIDATTIKPIKENLFLLMDKQEKEKEGKMKVRWEPLSGFPEICPPGGYNSVVLYTTTLRGVRKTFENCNTARSVLESHRFAFDERDVALHGKFLTELKELLGDQETGKVPTVPRLFVKGRYLGGVEEVINLNETGRLGRILSWAKVERDDGTIQGCEGCGGARFVPCLECGGSCKVLVGDKLEKERCPVCNENGLVLCPMCH